MKGKLSVTLADCRRQLTYSIVAVVTGVFSALLLLGAGHAQSNGQWYMVDSHVHSSLSSDAYVDLGIISQSASANGYSGLFLTDHNNGSSFHVNNLNANNMAFEDTYTRWTSGTYGTLAETVNALVSSPVNSGSKALRLKSRSTGTGETYIWAARGPNLRSGDIILRVAIRPVRIDPGSGVYVSVSLGGDPRVLKTPFGYTTANGTVSPGKSTVLVWQLGTPRVPDSNPMTRVLTYDLGSYTLNQWQVYTINVSAALQDIPAADRALDSNGLVHVKIAATANNGTSEAYFDTYQISASAPVAPANEFVYRNSLVNNFNTANFTLFASGEMGQQKHTQRFNFAFLDPSEFRNYTYGSDSIAETHQTGYPAQLNHPGVTITTAEVVQTRAQGADFVEAREVDQIDAWDGILKQGIVVLGEWSSDTHSAGFGSKPAAFVYATARDFDNLIQAKYEGSSFNAIGNFQGRLIFNVDGNMQVPHAARYPVYVSDAATSANVHLVVTSDIKTSYRIRWLVNGVQIIYEAPPGTSYNATKSISLSGASTYVRSEVLSSSSSTRAATQPIFFVDVPGLPAAMRYYVLGVETPNGRDYNNERVRGIVGSSWSAGGSALSIDLSNPVGSLARLLVSYGNAPQRVLVDSQVVNPAPSQAAFDAATGSSWFYDAPQQALRLKVSHIAALADLSIEYGAPDTTPPTAPSNLTATANGAASVSLAWSAAVDQSGIDYYAITRDGSPLATVEGNVLAYDDLAVQAGSTYVYTVSAFDPAGNRSPESGEATATLATDSELTLTPVADSYVNESSPSSNYGGSTSLRMDTYPVNKSYVRFNLQGVSGIVTNATLRLFPSSNSSQGYNVHGVDDNSWNEFGINYTNAPAFGPVVGGSGKLTSGTWSAVNVTSLVTGNGSLNLALTGISSTAFNLHSREGANAPRLEISMASGAAQLTSAEVTPGVVLEQMRWMYLPMVQSSN